MLTRGIERYAVDFYDQALRKGNILVMADADEDESDRLSTAEAIFAQAGAKPLTLPPG